MTALQELRHILDTNRNWSADFIFDNIDKLLEKEKQQIINAFIGYNSIRELNLPFAEQYYNKTYNNLNK